MSIKRMSWFGIAREFLETNNWTGFTKEQYEDFRIREYTERGIAVDYQSEDGNINLHEPVNHHNPLKTYEIWVWDKLQGYMELGKVDARNFAQAVGIFEAVNYLKKVEQDNHAEATDRTAEYISAMNFPANNEDITKRYAWSAETAAASLT